MKRKILYGQGIAEKAAAGVTAADDSEIMVILIKLLGLGKPVRSVGSRGIASEVLGG